MTWSIFRFCTFRPRQLLVSFRNVLVSSNLMSTGVLNRTTLIEGCNVRMPTIILLIKRCGVMGTLTWDYLGASISTQGRGSSTRSWFL